MSSNCICIAAPYAPQLSDEDDEQDPDHWCSHSAWGQECWQLVSQWVWNLRAVRWGISCILMPCARPSLLLPSHLPHPPPLLHRKRPPPPATLPPTWASPGNPGASLDKHL